MKRRLSHLSVLLASAGLTLLGFNGCAVKKQAASLSAAEEEALRLQQEVMRQDSIRKAYADSMQMVRISQTKCVYGGPTMMGRFNRDSVDTPDTPILP